MIEKWTKRKAGAKREKRNCVIRAKTDMKQGTIEEMECVLKCVKKGCFRDPSVATVEPILST